MSFNNLQILIEMREVMIKLWQKRKTLREFGSAKLQRKAKFHSKIKV